MGATQVRGFQSPEERRAFTTALLRDMEALRLMVEKNVFQTGVRKMGVEQEMFLVDSDGYPAPQAEAILQRLGRADFTTELAKYNLEANLDPQPLDGRFLTTLEASLDEVVDAVRQAGSDLDVHPLLVGILPTLCRRDLTLGNMSTPPRYRALNDGLMQERGGPYPVVAQGVDSLDIECENVMVESSSTSFQLHYQVSLANFALDYNLAQLISAPLLASACNSPLVLGRRLWHESRVAMFEKAADSRTRAERARGAPPRVDFGNKWITSPDEIFEEDILRFRPILYTESVADPVAELLAGRFPKLRALSLHNGTVWRWNRVCFGVGSDTEAPHLRIENRVLPAGPTVVDEVANAALFYGLMVGMAGLPVHEHMLIDDARANFRAAARYGLAAEFRWLDGEWISAVDLLLHRLLPVARDGLVQIGVSPVEAGRHLEVIQRRVRSRMNGAQWALDAWDGLSGPPESRARAITRAMMEHQSSPRSKRPVHSWPPPTGLAALPLRLVADVMTADVFTVLVDDAVDLAEATMDWKHVRHVPVEDTKGNLVGLVRHTALLRAQRQAARSGEPIPISNVMDVQMATVSPRATIADGVAAMLRAGESCQLVVEDGRLLGIVTERDYMRAAVTADRAHFGAGGAADPTGVAPNSA